MTESNNLLRDTQTFWDSNPCDGLASYATRYRFRYGKEPWLPAILKEIATSGHTDILEVGCGQGTDALTICSQMTGGRYTGLDLSPESVATAKSAVEELNREKRLPVVPVFIQGNAEKLPFADSSFDCVFSGGVLHHTPDTEGSIEEVRRVLKKAESHMSCCTIGGHPRS